MKPLSSGFIAPKWCICPMGIGYASLFLKLQGAVEVCRFPENNVALLVQFEEKLLEYRCRPDWVFVGAVRMPDKDVQRTEDTWCAGREREEETKTADTRQSFESFWMARILLISDLMLILLLPAGPHCSPAVQHNNFQDFLLKDASCLVPQELRALLFPVYQLSKNLHFNWILTFEPNYSCWATGAPSEKTTNSLEVWVHWKWQAVRDVHWLCRI